MPKYGIHLLVLNEAIESLDGSSDSMTKECAQVLRDHKFLANLGAIGPDMFFFAADYDVMHYANIFLPVLEFAEEMDDIYTRLTGPIRRIDALVDDKVEETFDALGLGVVTKIRRRIDSIDRLLSELKDQTITAGALAGINPLHTETDKDGRATSYFTRVVRELYENFLIPPNQNNYEEVDWYWFDMLHYRHVGDFARSLVRNAQTDRQRAYAFGYLTHIATDVVGHPYVNQIVGGPFRLAVQRHVTVENYMDVYQYHAHNGKVVSQSLYDDLEFGEADHAELPDEIAKLLATAFEETYGHVVHPRKLGSPKTALLPPGPVDPDDDFGFLTRAQIKDCYNWLRRAVELLGDQTDRKPRPPRSIARTADEDLAEIIDAINAVDPPPPPPAVLAALGDDLAVFGALFSGDVNLSDIADAVTAAGGDFEDWVDQWMGYMGESIQYSLETARQLAEVARGIVQLGADMTAGPLLVVLYGIQCAVYDMIKECRRMIALNGLAYPDVESIDDHLSKSLMFIFDDERHWIPAEKTRRRFPKLRAKGQVHLIEPLYAAECNDTAAAFHRPSSRPPTPADFVPDDYYLENAQIIEPATPGSFIQDEPFDVDALKLYAAAATPEETRDLQEAERAIGNAVAFSAWLIAHAADPGLSAHDQARVFTNWNLDGDRGYGAKSWTGLVPNNWDSSVNEKLCIALAAHCGAPADLVNLTDPHTGLNVLDPVSGIILLGDDVKAALKTGCEADSADTDYLYAKIKTKDEAYPEKRTWADLRYANLLVSEANVPAAFATYKTANAAEWAGILAPRLAVDGAGRRQNLYHINGIGTPLYNALYERYNVEHYFTQDSNDDVRVRLLYNFTDNSYPLIQMGMNSRLSVQANLHESLQGELIAVSDGLQAVRDKIWSYRALTGNFAVTGLDDLAQHVHGNSLNFGQLTQTALPKIRNATTVAVIAVLYDAFNRGADVGFIGYSHGTQIVFNGILAFALRGGVPEREFLKQRVRVFFTGRMVDELSITLLQTLINDFDQLANQGDEVAMSLGNIPPSVDFLAGLSQTGIEIGLENNSIRNGLVDFLAAKSGEQHKFYLYAPEIAAGQHQDFF